MTMVPDLLGPNLLLTTPFDLSVYNKMLLKPLPLLLEINSIEGERELRVIEKCCF